MRRLLPLASIVLLSAACTVDSESAPAPASGKPTPITYATPKPAAIVEEDRIIEAWPLDLAEQRMTTIPVAEAFER